MTCTVETRLSTQMDCLRYSKTKVIITLFILFKYCVKRKSTISTHSSFRFLYSFSTKFPTQPKKKLCNIFFCLKMATNENGNETRSECLVRMYNEESNIETIRYFECRKTLMEMLHDRGYNVSESDLTLSLSEFCSRFGEFPKPDILGVSVSLRSNPSIKVLFSIFIMLLISKVYSRIFILIIMLKRRN